MSRHEAPDVVSGQRLDEFGTGARGILRLVDRVAVRKDAKDVDLVLGTVTVLGLPRRVPRAPAAYAASSGATIEDFMLVVHGRGGLTGRPYMLGPRSR